MGKAVDVIPRVIYIPAREIVRMGRERWIIYLPRDYNELWEEIKRKGLKARVYLEVVEPSQETTPEVVENAVVGRPRSRERGLNRGAGR